MVAAVAAYVRVVTVRITLVNDWISFIPTLLFAKLTNIYIIIMLFSTVWLGIIGLIDDYIKVFKKDKEGLAGRFKILGQVGIGLIVGLVMVFHSDIVVKDEVSLSSATEVVGSVSLAQKSSKTTKF